MDTSKYDQPCHLDPQLTYRQFILAQAAADVRQREIARMLGAGYTRDQIKNVIATSRPVLTPPLVPPQPAPLTERRESSDFLDLTVKRTRIQTLEELITFGKIDLDTWEVVDFVQNSWEGFAMHRAKDGPDEVEIVPLYQVKARFKKKHVVLAARREIEALLAHAREHAPHYAPFPRPAPTAEGHLLELTIPDLHVGKNADAEATGEAYSIDIAVRRFQEALEDLVAQATSSYQIDQILLVVGNDLLNVDSRIWSIW